MRDNSHAEAAAVAAYRHRKACLSCHASPSRPSLFPRLAAMHAQWCMRTLFFGLSALICACVSARVSCSVPFLLGASGKIPTTSSSPLFFFLSLSLSLSLSFHLVPPSISDIDKIVVSLTVYLTFRSWSKQTGRLLRSVTLINYLGRRSIRWKSTVTDPTKKIPVFSRYPPLF